MVTRYGMSDVLGKVSVNYDDMGQSLSSETRAQVENEVRPAFGSTYARWPCCIAFALVDFIAPCCMRDRPCCMRDRQHQSPDASKVSAPMIF